VGTPGRRRESKTDTETDTSGGGMGGTDFLKTFLLGYLNLASKKLAETNEPQTAETLSELVVEQVAKQLADPATKSELARKLEPLVQAWLDGNLS
jgi:hypothetical protein